MSNSIEWFLGVVLTIFVTDRWKIDGQAKNNNVSQQKYDHDDNYDKDDKNIFAVTQN